MVYILAYQPCVRQKAALMGTIALSKMVTFPLLLLASRILFATDASIVASDLERIDEVTQLWMLPFCLWTLGVTLSARREGPSADATLVAWLTLESVALSGSLLEKSVKEACGIGSQMALLALAWTHISRLSSIGHADHELQAATDGDYILMTSVNGRAKAGRHTSTHPVCSFAARTFSVLAGALLPAMALIHFGGGVQTSRTIPCLGSDAFAPRLIAGAHGICSVVLGAALLALLNLDNERDVRQRDPVFHEHLQKVDAILILSATQLLLSSTSLASLPTLPSSELPEGSFALMLALIGALRGARAIAVFVMFGWQPLQKAWLWAHTVIRRAGRT